MLLTYSVASERGRYPAMESNGWEAAETTSPRKRAADLKSIVVLFFFFSDFGFVDFGDCETGRSGSGNDPNLPSDPPRARKIVGKATGVFVSLARVPHRSRIRTQKRSAVAKTGNRD